MRVGPLSQLANIGDGVRLRNVNFGQAREPAQQATSSKQFVRFRRSQGSLDQGRDPSAAGRVVNSRGLTMQRVKMRDDAIVARNNQLRSRGFDCAAEGGSRVTGPIDESLFRRRHPVDRVALGRDRLDDETRLPANDRKPRHIGPLKAMREQDARPHGIRFAAIWPRDAGAFSRDILAALASRPRKRASRRDAKPTSRKAQQRRTAFSQIKALATRTFGIRRQFRQACLALTARRPLFPTHAWH